MTVGAVVVVAVGVFAIPSGATREATAALSAADRLIFSVYSCDDCGHPIYKVDSDGSHLRYITDGDNPAWSPNRKKIAYEGKGAVASIYVFNLDGLGLPTDVREIPKSESAEHARWAPDGRRIVYENFDGGLAISNVAGGAPRILGPSWAREPDWSPEGKRIAFSNFLEEEGGIYIMNVDGTGMRRVTQAPGDANDGGVRWSPNGKRLLFYRQGLKVRDAKGNWLTPVLTVSPNGGVPKRLFIRPSVIALSWSPDGRQIAYADGGHVLRIFDIRTRRHRALRLQPCGGIWSCQDVDW